MSSPLFIHSNFQHFVINNNNLTNRKMDKTYHNPKPKVIGEQSIINMEKSD
jgi:hypothetical protein